MYAKLGDYIDDFYILLQEANIMFLETPSDHEYVFVNISYFVILLEFRNKRTCSGFPHAL